jgi:hypothetical protein
MGRFEGLLLQRVVPALMLIMAVARQPLNAGVALAAPLPHFVLEFVVASYKVYVRRRIFCQRREI